MDFSMRGGKLRIGERGEEIGKKKFSSICCFPHRRQTRERVGLLPDALVDGWSDLLS